MVEVMWFVRGAQSAVFYYVACTPCTDVKYRRKRRKEAAQSRAERQALEKEQPHIISQPLPSSTNNHWREEIARGPGPPIKRGHGPREPVPSRTVSRKGTGSSGQGSSTGPPSGEVTTAGNGTALSTRAERTDTSRQQREDEELWGEPYDVNRPGRNGRSSHKREGSSVGLPGRGRADTGGSDKYYVLRNPAVNELHPAVVSSPSVRRCETIWMLQPPPRAKVMEAKESGPVQSIRSRGSAKRRRDLEGKQSSWTLGGRSQKISGEYDYPSDTPALALDKHDFGLEPISGQRHDRDLNSQKRKHRPPAISVSNKPSSQDNLPSPDSRTNSPSLPRRPPLATVKSSPHINPHLHNSHEFELALATSSLSSDSTLTSRSLSPSSSKLPFDKGHPDGNFLPTISGDWSRPDVPYWEHNDTRCPGKANNIINNNENEKPRNMNFGPPPERYGNIGASTRFWRWSMDI